jgi:hypothetical protein
MNKDPVAVFVFIFGLLLGGVIGYLPISRRPHPSGRRRSNEQFRRDELK